MLLKDLYSREFYGEFTGIAKQTLPNFEEKDFFYRIFNNEFDGMELKQRIRHTAKVLAQFLPQDFRDAMPLLTALSQNVKKSIGKNQSFEYIFLADYIQEFGVNYFDESMQAIEVVTQCSSCEFAIRPFLLRYFEKTMKQMQLFALHNDANVRRFSSEGSRPRLPWGMGVPSLKQQPETILPILESLQFDSSEYVRRSVANNLNDISKDHQSLFITTIQKWYNDENLHDILRHASRTLLKQGNKEIGQLFGLKTNVITITDWKVQTPTITIGESVEIDVEIENTSLETVNARIEYVLYFLMKNGEYSKKVFMISKQSIEGKCKKKFTKRHSFKPITTRTYYKGEHKISIQVNGVESSQQSFILL
jgi:3-methyladenine DNA glycosylase AlkC